MNSPTACARVFSFSFRSFIATQFLGAFNDNAFKLTAQLLLLAAILADATQKALAAGAPPPDVGKLESHYISIALAVFIAPFILFSTYAGQLADRFSKTRVIIYTKVWEILAMALAVYAFWRADIPLLYVVLFLMGMQSAFFSPAKYGLLPEALPEEDLSHANGILEMTTFLAIILGTVLGGFIYGHFHDNLALGALVFVAIAVAGWAASLATPKVPPAARAHQRFRWNVLGMWYDDARLIAGHSTLVYAVAGMAYFWLLGGVLQSCLILHAKNDLGMDPSLVGIPQAALAIGIGAGSYLAGIVSGGKVEVGLTPLGAIGISVFSVLMYFVSHSVWLSCLAVALLGFSGGFFIVPLNALLQRDAPAESKGRIIAFANIITALAIFGAALLVQLLMARLGLTTSQVYLTLGLCTLGFTVYVCKLAPIFVARLVLWLFRSLFYRVRFEGREHIPATGPALLVANHVSYVDVILIAALTPRLIRFAMYRNFYEWKPLNWFFRAIDVVPITNADAPREIMASLRELAKRLEQGELVMIFPEGGLTRTGEIGEFKRGFELIMALTPKELDAPVIPIYLGGLWGSIFSYEGGKLLWKWPKRLPYRVTVRVGEPLPKRSSAREVEAAIRRLAGPGDQAPRGAPRPDEP